ncbi:hypothetical protein ABBQ32_007585 [Trebouxia sp. C0010 RCD-2024]
MKENDASFASLQDSSEKLCGFLDWLQQITRVVFYCQSHVLQADKLVFIASQAAEEQHCNEKDLFDLDVAALCEVVVREEQPGGEVIDVADERMRIVTDDRHYIQALRRIYT